MQSSARHTCAGLLRSAAQRGVGAQQATSNGFAAAITAATAAAGRTPIGSAAAAAAQAGAAAASKQPARWWLQLRRTAATSAAEAGTAAQRELAADMKRARGMTIPVGGLAGIIGSVAGAGGAAVIVPLISRLCKSIPQRVISGTSLAAVLSTALISTATYTTNDCLDLSAALLISPPAVLLAPLGARYTSRLNCNTLKRLLGYFLLAAAPLIPLKAYLFSAREMKTAAAAAAEVAEAAAGRDGSSGPVAAAAAAAVQPQAATPAEPSTTSGGGGDWAAVLQGLRDGMPEAPVAAILIVTGAVAGFASGLLGIGGGTIVTPVVALVMPYGQATVLGTSLLAMVPPSAVALLQHHKLGNVDWRMAAGLAVGTIVGGAAGSQAAVHAPAGALEGCFTVAMLMLARMTLKGVR